jgi:hypothetical protein
MKTLKNISTDKIIKIVALTIIFGLIILFICNVDLQQLNRAF